MSIMKNTRGHPKKTPPKEAPAAEPSTDPAALDTPSTCFYPYSEPDLR